MINKIYKEQKEGYYEKNLYENQRNKTPSALTQGSHIAGKLYAKRAEKI